MIEGDTFFDDAQRPVPSVAFPFDEVDTEVSGQSDDELALVRQQTLARVVAFLASGRCGALAVGRRVLLLDHVLSRSTAPQKELAQRLGVTEACVSKAVKRLKRGMRALQAD